MSEWFFAAVNSAYVHPTPLVPDRVFSVEQQFRIKHDMPGDVRPRG